MDLSLELKGTCVKLDQPRLIDQCHVLCGSKLLHMRILCDGENHFYHLHLMHLTAWRLVLRSAPAIQLSFAQAKALAEEQARISCGVTHLVFKWASPGSAPSPVGRFKGDTIPIYLSSSV
jgi:hypothetical protein